MSLLPSNFPTGRNKTKRCSTDEAINSFIDAKPVSCLCYRYMAVSIIVTLPQYKSYD